MGTKSITKTQKHETHIEKAINSPDGSEEDETPKNQDFVKQKDHHLPIKNIGKEAESISEYESESFPIESPTDDDVEKSILDLDSDIEHKPTNFKKQTKNQ